MDNKNVFVAIALSMSVLLFWGALFETPEKDNQTLKNNTKTLQTTEESITPNTNPSPSINQINIEQKLSRKDSINPVKRFKLFDNITLNGSYNFAADSLKFSPISISGTARFFNNLTVGNFSFVDIGTL